MRKGYAVFLVMAGALALTISSSAQVQPKMVTISGTVVDLTCSSKAYAMGMKWANAKEDHMLEGGKVQKDCATMCLKSGQPAALFTGNTLTAVFSCDPRQTLAGYATQQVEVQGFWAGDGKDVKAFVPAKIRTGAGAWKDVSCAEQH